MSTSQSREFLLDVSRLIWRTWRGKLPTGIDRVCLEYVKQFGPRSQAVVQLKGMVFVLSPDNSDRLFTLLRKPPLRTRLSLAVVMAKSLATSRRSPPSKRMFYLNVGHTGLHEPALPAWIAKHRVRAIYLIHDLIPMTHPQFCRAGEAGKHVVRMRNALVSAAGVIGNSQSTLDELAAFAASSGLPMPPQIAAWISGKPSAKPLPVRSFERAHFVTVGTVEARKNHLLLLKIWRKLIREMGDDAPILFVVGQRGWEAGEAFALLDSAQDLKGHVRELGQCTDAELDELIGGARALLMPSLAEGFGLPVTEALELGTPVIASDLPVFREIAGTIPTYLSSHDSSGWEQAIRSFASDSSERERQLKQIRSYHAPTWTEHFNAVEAWLKTL